MKPETILHHGDCLDVAAAYADGQFTLLLTSTPYPKQRSFALDAGDYLTWWRERAAAWVPKLHPERGVLVQVVMFPRVGGRWGGGVLEIPGVLEGLGLGLVDVYVWDKLNSPPSGNQLRHDRQGWEFVFVLARSLDGYVFNPQRGEYASSSRRRVRGSRPRGADVTGNLDRGHGVLHPDGARLDNVIRLSSSGGGSRPRALGGSFPLGLAQRFIRQYTNEGDWVIDPFCGVGTVGKAAGDLGRHFVGVDVDGAAVAAAGEWMGEA